jgi:transcriptional regulator with XRE-family HTH domain
MAAELQKLFGRNVRQLREAQGLTQEEFARKAGINRSYLGGVERGQRTICMDNIAKIANALAVSPDALFKADTSANVDIGAAQ